MSYGKAIAALGKAYTWVNVAEGDIELGGTEAPSYVPQCDQSVADLEVVKTDILALVVVIQ